jgi:subtilisin family serine protease
VSQVQPLRILVLAFALVLSLVAVASPAATVSAGTTQTYIVLYSQLAVPADASAAITRAGGTLVYSYDAIGVAIARSDNATFRANVMNDSRVEGAAATAGFAVKLRDDTASDAAGGSPGDLPNAPASDADNLSPLQWDMRQIKTPEAHAITGGSPAVLVGDIDTGLDYNHPDLKQNVDDANSVNCVSGTPVPGAAAANDDNGHGTHTAGTIAAAANGFGIVGVAPNVRIAGIKAGNADGFFYPEAVVCAFVWAGSHHFDVTNNSYFADPWLFNCRNDPGQRAIWKAEQRAIRYAMTQGVTVVAAAGNDNYDLAHPTVDPISPDDQPPPAEPREVNNACVVIPVEIPGVIGVSADGNLQQKSYYSNYGVGVIQVVAPGGDRRFQVTAEAPNGRVLSTYPAKFFDPTSPLMVQDCSVSPCAVYAYLQGTSMASPHVAGVAALIVSRYGDSQNPQNGKVRPGQVNAYITQTADPMPCPPNPFNPGPPFTFLATCQGGTGYNSFYGNGQVNALKAVTK